MGAEGAEAVKITVLADGMFLTWECDDYHISEDGYLTLVKKTGPGGKKVEDIATFNNWTMIAGGEVKGEADE